MIEGLKSICFIVNGYEQAGVSLPSAVIISKMGIAAVQYPIQRDLNSNREFSERIFRKGFS